MAKTKRSKKRAGREKTVCNFLHSETELLTFEDGKVEKHPAYWCGLIDEGIPCPYDAKFCLFKQHCEDRVSGIRIRPNGTVIEVDDPELMRQLDRYGYGDSDAED